MGVMFNCLGSGMASSPLPPMIAVIGCDGSGKSTLTQALHEWLSASYPTAMCHLGKQSGNMARAIGRLPLFGKKLERTLHKKAKGAQSKGGPGLVTAIGVYAFAIRQERRFHHMLSLRQAGRLIIADRFPQTEIPASLDGVGLGRARPTGLIGWLARAEKRKFDRMVAHHPDLILRLNVSLDVAIARKPDHDPDSLALKVADLSHLHFQGAPIVEIDADAPFEDVLANAKSAITNLLKNTYPAIIAEQRTP